MSAKWFIKKSRVNTEGWAKELCASEFIVKLLANRGISTIKEAYSYLYGSLKDLADPCLMKGMKEAIAIIRKSYEKKQKVAIATDYDCDGIFAAQILADAFRKIGIQAEIFAPRRNDEGYGLNQRIVEEAKQKGCDLLLTCDNGIAAFEAIDYAKQTGLTVIVTDHHEVQYELVNGEKMTHLPNADVIIDPHQADCPYPFKALCGAGIAFRFAEVLYREFQIERKESEELLEYVSLATIADVVDLKGENRILVKEGLKKWNGTKKVPLRAMIEACSLQEGSITARSIGFVLAPSFNSVGRLGDVKRVFNFLKMTDYTQAIEEATAIRELNETRKRLTEEGTALAEELLATGEYDEDKIILLNLSKAEDSVIGIIAGRLKEKLNKPVIIFTKVDNDHVLRGSGRSIPEYDLCAHLNEAAHLLERFGGHKLAAGLSICEEKLAELRTFLNEHSELSKEDLIPKIYFDAELPIRYATESLVEEMKMLEPYGTGNDEPLFARKPLTILGGRVLGKNESAFKATILDGDCRNDEVLFFGTAKENLQPYLPEECKEWVIGLLFSLQINEFRGFKTVQIVAKDYCKISEKSV